MNDAPTRATSPALRVTVLGQLRVEGGDGAPRPLTATSANLIASLVTAPGQSLSVAGLTDDVWPDRLPERPKAALQTVVSRLRAHCRPGLLRSTPGGYGIDLDGGEIDLDLAARILHEARAELRAGASATAERLCRQAESLWYGEPGTGVPNPVLAQELRDRARAIERELARIRAEAVLAAGHAQEAVGLLADLARAEPFNDHIAALRLRALAATGRVNEAIDAYGEFRALIAHELGTDPAPQVTSLYEGLLHREDPLLAPGPRRVGLHAPLEDLVGRSDDIATVRDLLARSRLVSLTGAGGLGKTRLASAVAWEGLPGLPATVVVELAGARSAEDASRALTHALDLPTLDPGLDPESPDDRGARAVLAALAEHGTLLVLDNCEHLAPQVARWVTTILRSNDTTRVLVTSRTPLYIGAEHVHELRPLPVHDGSGGPGPAMELFGVRARAVRADVHLDRDQVARLCARLDGIPLAIELAAARARALSVPEIDSALDDRFALLRTVDPTSAPRHRALHDVVEWSWDLLSERQRELCRRAAVFPDGFDARAAAFLADTSRIDLLDDLDALVAQSLVQATEDRVTGRMRYRMYETIREFAERKADEADEGDLCGERAADWARSFALYALGALDGPAQTATTQRVAAEQGNLRSVLRTATDAADLDTAVPTGLVLGLWALVRTDFGDLAAVMGPLRDTVRGYHPPPALAMAHLWFSILRAPFEVSFGSARGTAVALIELRRVHALVPRPGPSATALSRIMLAIADPARFAAEVARGAGSTDPTARRLCLLLEAFLAENAGALLHAARSAGAAHALAERAGDTWSAAFAAQLLTGIHAQQPDPHATIAWAGRAGHGFAALGIDADLRTLARHVACAHLVAGDLQEAERGFRAFADVARPLADGDVFGGAGLAEVHLARSTDEESTAHALAEYRAVLAGSATGRLDTILWRLLIAASCIAGHVLRGRGRLAALTPIVERERAFTVEYHRDRPQTTDGPLLGAVAGAFALWLAARGEAGDAPRALALLDLMEDLGSRQDLPGLDRERTRDAVHRLLGTPPGAPARDEDPTGGDPVAELLRRLDSLDVGPGGGSGAA